MVGEVETSSASSYTYLSAKHAGQMERKKEEKREEEGEVSRRDTCTSGCPRFRTGIRKH